jgi:MFS family permease
MHAPGPAPNAQRNVYIFGATSFFNDIATEMAYWVLPAFVVSLGGGPAALGVIEGIAESVAALGQLFSGYLTDRMTHRKPLVVAGYFAANVVKPFLAISTHWWHILLVRFSDRMAKGLRATPRDVMLAGSVPKSQIGSAYGLLQSMDSAGAVIGPLLALFILSRSGNVRTVFWWAAAPGALAFLAVLLAKEVRTVKASGRPDSPASTAAHLPARFYYMLLAVLIFSLGNSSDMFLVLRAQQSGISLKFAPLLGLVFNLTYTLASWPAGWFSDRFSKPAIAVSGYVVFAATYFVFAKAPSHAALWIMMSCYGFYYALTSPVLRALVVETVPADSRGRAFGIFYFVTSITALLASLITGELWKHFGPELPFSLSALLALIAAAMLFAAFLKSPRNSKESLPV